MIPIEVKSAIFTLELVFLGFLIELILLLTDFLQLNGFTASSAAPLSLNDKLLFLLPLSPVNALSQGFSTVQENGERPQQLVSAKYLVEIELCPDVVLTAEGLSFVFESLQGRFVLKRYLNVELQEECDQACHAKV